jgi:2-polyprenyl-3-methyl-5-hydroxy-6-metoxy-1,4-benzoquinol methylase
MPGSEVAGPAVVVERAIVGLPGTRISAADYAARVIDADSLRERVESFPRWHYEFDLGGVRTPIFNRAHANRHAQRKEYFFSPLVQLCGGTLAGKRVLDLGCNAGYWSLAAIEAGADFVLGIDGREMHVDQANLVFEANGVEPNRYRFELGNIFELDLRGETFDIVLCLGLLYHVSRPFELMERMAAWNTDLLVIDSTLDSRVDGAYFRVVTQNLDDPRSALDRPIALRPTSKAVVALAEAYGYRCVMLRPRFSDWSGSKRYRNGTRRAFICSRQTSLAGLDVEPLTADARPSRREPSAVRSVARSPVVKRVRSRLSRLLARQ